MLRAHLVIVDDIGLLAIYPDAAEGFHRLVDAAYEKRGPAISFDLHPGGFDRIMDCTVATAPVDGLLRLAHVLVPEGDRARPADALAGQGASPLARPIRCDPPRGIPVATLEETRSHTCGEAMTITGEKHWPPARRPR